MNRESRGFTLIELLAVIAMIGILSMSVLAAVGQSRVKARDAKRIASISEIQKSLEIFYDGNQTYPTTTPAGYVGTDAALQMMYTRGFLKSDPSLSGNTYVYFGGLGNQSPYTNCTGGGCQGYSLSVLMERDDNVTLGEDADAQVRDTFGVTIFDGDSPDCGSAAGAPEYCLDQTPLQIQL